MTEQEEFFSKRHNQLLKIAAWAKYLAWVALIGSAILSVSVISEKQGNYQQMLAISSSFQSGMDYWDVVRQNPLYHLFDIGKDMIRVFLGGLIYYVVLKGISLGLTMIVETDINYRDNENQGKIE